jgi:hypothetical protein
MARWRVGPVRVGGGRKISISANAGPLGVTIGGGRKRRSKLSTGTSTDATESSSGGIPYSDSGMSAAEALVWEVVVRVEGELGPDPYDETVMLDVKILVGAAWAAWLIFWGWAIEKSFIWSAWTWISLASLAFAQVMTSPSARYVSNSRRWERRASRQSISWLLLSTWATARTIPAITALPFLLTIALAHLLAISEYFDAPRGTLIAIIVYLLSMPPLTARRVRQVDENPAVAKDAVLQNLRNSFLLTYSVDSHFNVAKMKKELEWTVKCLDEIEKTAAARNCALEATGYSDFQSRERRLRTKLSEFESRSSAINPDTKRKSLKTVVLLRISGIYDEFRPRTRAEKLNRQALDEHDYYLGDNFEDM